MGRRRVGNVSPGLSNVSLVESGSARCAKEEPALTNDLVRAGFAGVSNGARTRDILDHNQTLYQLSYTHHAASARDDSAEQLIAASASA